MRASLCSASKILSHLGFLCSFALGAFLDFRQLACVCAGAPLTLFVTSSFVPETPSHLLLTGERDRARDALIWLQDGDVDDDQVEEELDRIGANLSQRRKKAVKSTLLKPLAICCGLAFFARFCGVPAVNAYAVTVFGETFLALNPHLAAVIVASVQLFASAASGLIADRFGRVPLLAATSGLMAAAFAAFGSLRLYDAAEDWMSLICVIVFVGAFSLGVNPISWLLIGEIFPLEYRHIGPPLATAFGYICAFVNVKSFVDLRDSFGLEGVFWAFSGVSALGLIFCVVFVPETKGKSLEEMK